MSTATPVSSSEQLVGRCYTAARRYPLQVGRFANGGRIPGGPYTMTQLAVMIGLFVVLVVTRPVWGGHGLLDIVVVLVVPYAAGWGICRVQIDHRNPLAAFASLSGALFSPPAGRIAGRPWRARPACRLAPLITVHVQAAEQAAPARARSGHAHSLGSGTAAPVVSGVQALLAQRAASRGTGQ
jgi:hypothetical protein